MPFVVDADIEGGWFEPATSGQGFLMDFLPGNPNLLFVAWFTFEAPTGKIGQPEHRWLVAQGPLVDANSAEMDLFSVSGGVFDQPIVVTTAPVGSLSIDFSSCREAIARYQFDDGLQGEIPIQPLDPSRATCESARGNATVDRLKHRASARKGIAFQIDDDIQGGWFEPATSGQGFLMDYIPGTPDQLFLAWFTFETDVSKIGAPEHRWFVAQGELPGGSSVTLPILSISDGVFDMGSAVGTNTVGTVTVDFSSCRSSRVDYQFDAGPSGQIDLQPLDPSRNDCELNQVAADAPDTCMTSAPRLFDGSLVSEEIKPVIDADFYRLVLDGTADVRLFTQGRLNTIGRLHDAQCQPLASDDDSGADSNFSLVRPNLSAGTYYVSVRSNVNTTVCPPGSALCKPTFSATGRYQIGAVITPVGGGAQPDLFPDTCSLSDAPSLGNGESISGRIDPASDLDFFRIDVATSNSVLRARSRLAVDVLGRLYDAACNPIASDDNGGSGSNFDVSATVAAGTYYASVESAAGATGQYTLDIGITPAMIPDDDFPDTCSASQSPLLGDGDLQAGLIEVGDDIDFFRVDVAQDLTELVAQSSGELDTVGRIYDAACNEIAFNDDAEDDNPNFVVSQVVDAGTYYVSVESFGEDVGPYNVSTSLFELTPGDDDFPNTCDLGQPPLANGSVTDGVLEFPNDLDFFRFELGQTAIARAFTDAEIDTVGRIYDSACNELVSNDDAFGSANFEIQIALDAGTYFVSVESFANAEAGNYRLNFELLEGGVGPGDDFPNTCDADNAPLLGNGDSLAGAIDPDQDRDFFRIDVEGSDINLRAFTTGGLDTVGRIYDAACNQIGYNDDAFGTLNFEINTLVDAGTYYVSVESFANEDSGPYTVNVEFLDGGVGAGDDFPNTCDAINSPSLGNGDRIDGRIEILTDRDFFRIDLEQFTDVRVSSLAEFDSFGRLYDASCEEIENNDDGFGTLDFEIDLSLDPGTYYFSIEALGAQDLGNYQVLVDFLIDGVSPGDDYPDSCDLENSPLLEDTEEIAGALENPTDQDFFRVDVVGQEAELRARTLSQLDTFGRLYDEGCNEFANNDDGFNTLDFDLAADLGPGIYFVSVEPLGGETIGEYVLRIDFLVDGVAPDDDYPDQCDFDHSPLLGDGETIAGSIESNLDRDFFRIDLAAGEGAIRAVSTTSTFDPFGRLYDAACEELAGNDDGEVGLDFDLLVEGLGAGTYYLSIEPLDDTSGDFQIEVTIDP